MPSTCALPPRTAQMAKHTSAPHGASSRLSGSWGAAQWLCAYGSAGSILKSIECSQEWEAALAANRMHLLPVPVFEGRTQDGKANGQSLVELAARDDMVDL